MSASDQATRAREIEKAAQELVDWCNEFVGEVKDNSGNSLVHSGEWQEVLSSLEAVLKPVESLPPAPWRSETPSSSSIVAELRMGATRFSKRFRGSCVRSSQGGSGSSSRCASGSRESLGNTRGFSPPSRTFPAKEVSGGGGGRRLSNLPQPGSGQKLMKLKKLAKLVFQLTRHEVWLGGMTSLEGPSCWPRDVDYPFGVTYCIFWSLSPEVKLLGHQVRVCVSSSEYAPEIHRVRVFIDGKLVHPGGAYIRTNYPWWWSTRIAKEEVEEGGKPSPVATRDLLIQAAWEKLSGGDAKHPQLAGPVVEEDPEIRRAVLEVESLLKKGIA